MFRSKKSLKKENEGQAKFIIELTEKNNKITAWYISQLLSLKEINERPTPRRNNWKLRQQLVNDKITSIIESIDKK